MRLTQKLEGFQKQSNLKKEEEIIYAYNKATMDLKASSIEENALNVGDEAPSFTLENAYGDKVSSKELLEKGPLVISFYRGKWCPYCNLELQAYGASIDKIKELGANFVAISPELPDESFSEKIPFEVLSDLESKVARKFKIVFELDQKVAEIYKGAGINLAKSNGDEGKELPIPATYVIDKSGKIALAFINADYTKRLDVEDVLEKLEEIK